MHNLLFSTCVLWLPFATQDVDYLRDVKPILSQHCLECHGPERDASGFRVDRWSSLLEGGEYGVSAVVPNKPEESFLLQVVDGSSEDLSMPPEGNSPLTAAQVETLRKWIAAGANVPEEEKNPAEDPTSWWSLQPVVVPEIPASANAIDFLVEEKLREHDLQFSPPADRVALIRRLYLVMLGLPPTPSEVKRFVDDDDPLAWERLVDHVLASPHYGERWARHWLDVVRFGETDGYETNRERPNAWRYRDWVIAAFNQDLPYNDFVKYQIAGDVIGQPVGTSFLVGGPHDIVKSPEVLLTLTQRQDELSDMVGTLGSSFLGLTVGCARCHNHKFDPISQTDFFSLQAVFAGVHHGESSLPEESPEQVTELQRIDEQFDLWQRRLLDYIAEHDRAALVWPPVDAAFNSEVFEPQPTRFLRFTIQQTNSGSEPCLDELEVFAGAEQVALATQGVVLSSSGDYQGNPRHRLAHLNDGHFGNDFSWIGNTAGTGWVQMEWPTPVSVDRVQWARDREGVFADRLPTKYLIEVSLGGVAWSPVASSEQRLPVGSRESSVYDSPMFAVNETTEEGGEASELAGREARETFGEQLQRLRKQRQQWTQSAMAFCGTFSQPQTIHKLFRGDPLSPREEVLPDTLDIFGSLQLAPEASDQERRLALANALVHPENPLVARVIVNRIWQYQFGTGIVETSSDFGQNAALPSHPKLLDWLAYRLQHESWSIKSLQREILLSETWQQSSRPNSVGLEVDAGSRWLWRFPPRRLEAEVIRDQILSVSGSLQLTDGGPGFSAFEVDFENVRHYHPLEQFGPEHFRRMVYQTKIRQEQDAVFGAFDCPDGTQIAPQRSRSTTPLQALNLFNSHFVWQQSQHMAERLEQMHPADTDEQIRGAFQLCFGRAVEEDELNDTRQFIMDQDPSVKGLVALCRVLLNSNEFLFIP